MPFDFVKAWGLTGFLLSTFFVLAILAAFAHLNPDQHALRVGYH
jgi:hypothetical protein